MPQFVSNIVIGPNPGKSGKLIIDSRIIYSETAATAQKFHEQQLKDIGLLDYLTIMASNCLCTGS